MDFSEFTRRIGAEPLSQDPELLAARAQGPEFEAAAAEAEAFEQKLAAALDLPLDPAPLLESLVELPNRKAAPRFNVFAIAASVLVVFGAATLVWYQSSKPDNLQEYLVAHYSHDGAKVLARADGSLDANEVNEVMAAFSANASAPLADRVSYIKFCPTLDSRGAHMIVATDDGPVTVIFMPNTQVTQSTLVRFDGMSARVINLDSGSAAIISPETQQVTALETLLQTSISFAPRDA